MISKTPSRTVGPSMIDSTAEWIYVLYNDFVYRVDALGTHAIPENDFTIRKCIKQTAYKTSTYLSKTR